MKWWFDFFFFPLKQIFLNIFFSFFPIYEENWKKEKSSKKKKKKFDILLVS